MNRIALRMPNWMGDLVLAAPAIRAFRARFPEASIECVAHPRVAPLLAAVPGAGEVVRLRATGLSGFRSDAAAIRARAYDLGVLFTDSFSSALLFWAGGVARKVGLASEGRGFLLDRSLRIDRARNRHLTEYYRDLAASLGAVDFQPGTGIEIPMVMRERGNALLRAAGVREGDALVALAPGARYGETKRWRAERYRALALRLGDQVGVRVLVLGEPAEESLCRAVAEGIPAAVSLGGRTSLEELLGILPDLRLLVANDSGVAHLAASQRVPVLVLFGSTSPRWTAPVGERVRVLTARLPCAPCFRRTCPIDVLCLREIEVEEVFRAAMAFLATQGEGPSPYGADASREPPA